MKRDIRTRKPEDGEKLARILSELEDFLAYWWGDRQDAVEYVDGVEADILEHDEDVLASRHEQIDTNWIDKHSINCYFCGELVDERDCMPADQWNNNNGGDICPICLMKKAKGGERR